MPTLGPIPANIAIIGDFPDRFGDGSSATFQALHRNGIVSTSCFFSTLTEHQPPDGAIDNWVSDRKTCPGAGWEYFRGKWWHPDLLKGCRRVETMLAEVAPRIVITLGKAALAYFCGPTAVDKWRGSRLSPPEYSFTVVPTFHPRVLAVMPERNFIFQADIKRAYNIYVGKQLPRHYNFIIKPSIDQAIETLTDLLTRADSGEKLKLSGDLETRSANIACFGIAWNETDAICIPHLVVHPDNPFYWSVDDEAQIVWLYAQLFHHPNILWVGQNYLYDCQYFHRHWGILPVSVRDTMIGHHSLHSNIRKGLDFLSSLYAHDHVYWKDEIKEWDPHIGEKQYWTYNCKDACITWEIDDRIVEAGIDR
jgi:hypothetical protein